MVVCEFGLLIPYLPWEVFCGHSGFLLHLKKWNYFWSIVLVSHCELQECLAASGLVTYVCTALSHSGALRTQWVESCLLQKVQIIVIVVIVLHQIWPLILPQCIRFVQKHPLFLEISIFRPLNTMCVVHFIAKKQKNKNKKKPTLYHFFKSSFMCTPIYVSAPLIIYARGGGALVLHSGYDAGSRRAKLFLLFFLIKYWYWVRKKVWFFWLSWVPQPGGRGVQVQVYFHHKKQQ